MMIDLNLSDYEEPELGTDLDSGLKNIQKSQEAIYSFLLKITREWAPEEVLLEFKHLFIECSGCSTPEVDRALYQIIFKNQERIFKNTLKRSCYILVNNWYAGRKQKFIQDLVQLFKNPIIHQVTLSPSIKCLRGWLKNFIQSEDYQALQLFSDSFARQERTHWSTRYASYLLVPQYIDSENPVEQRQAARELAKQLKDKFKLDLALYTARQSTRQGTIAQAEHEKTNPTQLGSTVIDLVKKVVSRQILFSYKNYAHIFTQQVQHLSYREFKQSFLNYLTTADSQQHPSELIKEKLGKKLEPLLENYHQETLNLNLLLRTCNRVIEFLTIESEEQPAELFTLLLAQDQALSLAIILLKIILICKYARTYLDCCIAKLIRYHDRYSDSSCQSFIHFLEVFNVVLTIYAENVQFNLVKVKDVESGSPLLLDLKAYRVFSQFQGADLRGASFKGIDLRGVNLSGADLRDAILTSADLRQANLSLAKLNRADLSGALLDCAELSTADLQNADLRAASLKGTDLRHADLRCANLSQADLTTANLHCANLQSTQLEGTHLAAASLDYANLRQADLSYADLQQANLAEADLSYSQLPGAKLVEANLYHAQLQQANLQGASLCRANLETGQLSNANLTAANLYRANLNRAHLEQANLSRVFGRCVSLQRANLQQACLQDADLSRADLSQAKIQHTNLRHALLRHASFRDSDLSHADLSGANVFSLDLQGAQLQATQLRGCVGLTEAMKLALVSRGAIV